MDEQERQASLARIGELAVSWVTIRRGNIPHFYEPWASATRPYRVALDRAVAEYLGKPMPAEEEDFSA